MKHGTGPGSGSHPHPPHERAGFGVRDDAQGGNASSALLRCGSRPLRARLCGSWHGCHGGPRPVRLTDEVRRPLRFQSMSGPRSRRPDAFPPLRIREIGFGAAQLSVQLMKSDVVKS